MTSILTALPAKPVYQHLSSPYNINKKIRCLVVRIEELITHSKLYNMECEILQHCFKGKYRYGLENLATHLMS